MSEDAINHAYLMAIESMGTLNRNSAKLMQKYGARGATDVTGFGLKGHTENLAAAQIEEVDLIIHSLPILADMETPIDGMHDFKVRTGSSAETSGGLLVMLGQAEARQFIEESESEFGQASWVVGEVVRGTRQALIREDAEVISIRDSFLKQL